jgi:hypothetical protein
VAANGGWHHGVVTLRARRIPRTVAKLALAAALLALAACGPRSALEDETPIDVSTPPEQTAVSGADPIHMKAGGFDLVLTPEAHYVLRGVVVSRESYHFGWNAEIAPCDVATVWGELAEGQAWRRLSWSQGGRWYFWRWSGERPFPDDLVVRNSSNTHLIPASSDLRKAARSLGGGDIVELSGELVAIEGRKGGQRVWWRSSLSRTDTGDGSCELLYLRRLKTGGKVYE